MTSWARCKKSAPQKYAIYSDFARTRFAPLVPDRSRHLQDSSARPHRGPLSLSSVSCFRTRRGDRLAHEMPDRRWAVRS